MGVESGDQVAQVMSILYKTSTYVELTLTTGRP